MEDDATADAAADQQKPPPFLLIVGAMKSGTTTLFEYLSQHPQIAASRGKEPNIFDRPRRRKAWEERRRRVWPDFDPARHRYAMEASTRYTKAPRFPHVPKRIARRAGDVRLIYIVRDPVERIESNFAHNLAKARVGRDVPWDHPKLRLAIDVSRYHFQLSRYARALPRAPLLVLDFDELKRDPLAMMRRCVDFLGIDPAFAFTPIPPANVTPVSGVPFALSEDMRARLRAVLAPDARRFAETYGFDIARWSLDAVGGAPPRPARKPPPAESQTAAQATRAKESGQGMKALFHIGMSKTGSTALQQTFTKSVDYLLSKGVLYPRNPKFPKSENHRLYATQIAPVDMLPRHMSRFGGPEEMLAHFADFHAHTRREIEARRPALLLLSAETMLFKPIQKGCHKKLVAALGELGPTPHFVAYIRRPSDWYVSILQQKLRAAVRILQPKPPPYRKLIGGYADLFGKENVSVHLFMRAALRDGDVVADFTDRYLAAYGVAFEELTKGGEANVGLSAEAMQIMQAFRRRFHAGEHNKITADSDRMQKALRRADAAVGAGKPRLRPGIAEVFDYAGPDPLWLRDQCGLVFPDFDYRRLEEDRFAEPPSRPLALDEIVEIDPAKREAIIDYLAQFWGGGRGPWLAELRRELAPA